MYGLQKAHPHTGVVISYPGPVPGVISAASQDWPGDHTAERELSPPALSVLFLSSNLAHLHTHLSACTRGPCF